MIVVVIEIKITARLHKLAGKFVPKEEIIHQFEEWYANQLPDPIMVDDSVYMIQDYTVEVK